LDAKRHLISGLPHHKVEKICKLLQLRVVHSPHFSLVHHRQRGALYEKFVKALETYCPETLSAAQEERHRWFGASKLAKLLAPAEPVDCDIACRPRSESDEYTQLKEAAGPAAETAQPPLEATASAASKPAEQAFSFSFSFF
jgi:hypothetical protein